MQDIQTIQCGIVSMCTCSMCLYVSRPCRVYCHHLPGQGDCCADWIWRTSFVYHCEPPPGA